MLHIQNYVKAQSLEEAYTLLMKNRNNQLLGGMCWLKMENRTIPTAICIDDLGLDQVEESDEAFTIGGMVSLRTLECHPGLNRWFHGLFKDALKDIVGTQLRRMATIGGSVYSRFGFSDPITALMVLDCDVILYHQGCVSLRDFVKGGFTRDIITHIVIKKTVHRAAFTCVRRSATDFSLLNMAMAKTDCGYRVSVGSRPGVSQYFGFNTFDLEIVKSKLMAQLRLGDNLRASQAYRERLVPVLCERLEEKL